MKGTRAADHMKFVQTPWPKQILQKWDGSCSQQSNFSV